MVVLVEDIHWAEEQLLDLLEHVLAAAEGPLLLVVTARPELVDRRPGWGTRVAGERLELQPLSQEQSVLMLDKLLSGGLPDELRNLVVDRAEGNPFFVEELLGMLVDQGMLRRSNGSWTLDELSADFAVPDSVHAVLAARIDLLEPAEKAALQAAAVIGRVFWAGPIYELVEVEPDLRVLEERDLIRRRGGSTMSGEREYAIKHALTREVAYASLPKARRARLHAAFAEWLERIGDRDELASFLAHHFAEAVRPEDADLAWSGEDAERERLREKALSWLERAGELAIGRFEIEDALALLRRALELEPGTEAQARLWRMVGKANALNFDGDAFLGAMQSSLDASSDPAHAGETYGELAFQSALRGGMWRRLPEPEVVEGWVDRALESSGPDSVTRAKALIARSIWLARPGPEVAQEAMELAERLGDRELLAYAWAGQCSAWLHSGPETSTQPSIGRRSGSGCWTRSAIPTTSRTSMSSRSPRVARPAGSTRLGGLRSPTMPSSSLSRSTIACTAWRCCWRSTRRKESGAGPSRLPTRRRPASKPISPPRASVMHARCSSSRLRPSQPAIPKRPEGTSAAPRRSLPRVTTRCLPRRVLGLPCCGASSKTSTRW